MNRTLSVRPGFIVLAAVMTVFIATIGHAENWRPVEGHAFKRTSDQGYCNCVFSSQEIHKGGENAAALKNEFTRPEPVYGRCYFPGPIGPVQPEDFWHEIWIDGQLAQITEFQEPPAADWDQTAVWITEDYVREMNALKPGRHEVVVWVMMNQYRGQRIKEGKNPLQQVRLSKGQFTYTVR
ncbi:MAG: hypothetical protein AB1641_21555 [Thermodesulfobacteriota bacterium]